VARSNGYALHNAGGTEILVDLAATAHEATDSMTVPTAPPSTDAAKLHAAQAPISSEDSVACAGGGGGGVPSRESTARLNGEAGRQSTAVAGATMNPPQLLTAEAHVEAGRHEACEWFCYVPQPQLLSGGVPVAVKALQGGPTASALSGSQEGVFLPYVPGFCKCAHMCSLLLFMTYRRCLWSF
jgi:hypothetical protein